MKLLTKPRSVTLTFAQLILPLLLISCSSAHVHQEFKYAGLEGLDSNYEHHDEKLSRYPTTKYNEVTLTIKDAKIQLALRPETIDGFTFIGPVLIPFFPLFWVDSKIGYATLDIKITSTSKSQLQIALDTVAISFDDGPLLFSSGNNFKNYAAHEATVSQHLLFNFEKINFPKRVKVVIKDIKLNGISEPTIVLNFEKDSYWHYVPLVFMHTD